MRFRPIFLAAALVAAAAAPLAHAQVVFSDNFDSNALRLDLAPAGWALTTEGRVNLIGESSVAGSATGLPDPLPGNGVYVDLIGTSGVEAILVSPTFSLKAGVEYTATFALAGNQSKGTESVQVNFGDTQFTYSIPFGQGFTTYALKFTPTSVADYSISFQTVGFSNSLVSSADIDPNVSGRGALLDAVAIAAVPEPASYALLLAGLVGLHVVARRRIQQ